MPTTNFRWTFQGGRKRTVTIVATAGNVATNLAPTLGKRWIILRGRLVLICEASAGNRYQTLVLTNGTNITEDLAQGAVTIISTTTSLSFGEVRLYSGTVPSSTLVGSAYIGVAPILIEGVDQFRIGVINGVAGDSYSGYVDVLEIDV